MKRILFVDDESNILDGIRRLLHAHRSRWDMHFVLGGEAALKACEAALKACEAASFDVVVSDMSMPGMDGATLLGHIRERYPGTARIVLSGTSEAGLAQRAKTHDVPRNRSAQVPFSSRNRHLCRATKGT